VSVVCCLKDAETSVAEFMETKPTMSDFDARLMYYMVQNVVLTLFESNK